MKGILILNTINCRCGVDAGMVNICDMNFYPDKNHAEDQYKRLGHIEKVPPGKYSISVLIRETWKGTISKTHIIDFPTGVIVIGDACYGFDDHGQWMDILDEYEYFDIDDDKIMTLGTGGDGEFDVQVTIESINEEEG